MELKTTTLGKRLAQHSYNWAVILDARIKVSGDHHEYLISLNQLLAIHCKHDLVQGEPELVLPDEKVVCLYGTEQGEAQRFYHYPDVHWRQWSGKMSEITSGVLRQQLDLIVTRTGGNKWLTREQAFGAQQQIRQALSALPLPVNRLEELDNCREVWYKYQAQSKDIEGARLQYNQTYTEAVLTEYVDSSRQVESSPLSPAQARTVVDGEHPLLVLAGTGSRKTSVLAARVGWLLARGEAPPEQILLLAFDRKAAEEMYGHIQERLHTEDITACTFRTLVLYIIQQGDKKVPTVNKLENGTAVHRELFIVEWRKQCNKKKAQMKGWRQWLTEETQWSVPGDSFWGGEKLQHCLASRLNHWVSLMRMHGGVQTEAIISAPEKICDLFSKHVKLTAPLLKVRKGALKAENAVDFSGLIHQAIVILGKGRLINPWKHILVNEFQDISPQHAALLAALRKQNSQTTLFVIGDDQQVIYRFSGMQVPLTTAFHKNFGEDNRCDLDTTYRFNSRIGEVTNRFIQQSSGQPKRPLNNLTNGDKKAVTLLDEGQLDALLDKLSGYAKPEERALTLVRYHHMRPISLEKATTR